MHLPQHVHQPAQYHDRNDLPRLSQFWSAALVSGIQIYIPTHTCIYTYGYTYTYIHIHVVDCVIRVDIRVLHIHI